jgi:hypothetical protein
MVQASSQPANRPTCLPILLEDASFLVIASPFLISTVDANYRTLQIIVFSRPTEIAIQAV